MVRVARKENNLLWKSEPNVGPSILVGMVNEAQIFTPEIERMFEGKEVNYSGIIQSNATTVSKGSDIEQTCYKMGGFEYLYKCEPHWSKDGYPILELIQLLESIAKSYVDTAHSGCFSKVKVCLAWAVCQRDGDFGAIHNHAQQDQIGRRFSGVLYLKTPDCIRASTFPAGCLHLIKNDSVAYFPPIENSVVIWPSETLHGIHPFRGEGDRLGIAFDFIGEV